MGRGGNGVAVELGPSPARARAAVDLGRLADSALEILLERFDSPGQVAPFTFTAADESPQEFEASSRTVETVARLRADALEAGQPLVAVFQAHDQHMLFGIDPRSRSWTLSVIEVKPAPGSSEERIALEPVLDPLMAVLQAQVLGQT